MSPATATAPQRASALLHDGYAVLGGFLEAAELPLFRSEAERLLKAPADNTCKRPHNTLVPLSWNDFVVSRVLESRTRTSRLRAALDGEDLRWVSGYLSIKEPHSPALAWHQDWWCWHHPVSFHREAAQVALLCYLTATDDRNAALRVLPGSHHASTSLHAVLPEAHAEDAPESAATHPAMSDHPDQVTLALSAGDAVAIDYRLLHGTHANTTESRRDCLVLNFAPCWSALPDDIRAHLIRHPALPADEDAPTASWASTLLPSYGGLRRDLPLTRAAPRRFTIERQGD